MVAASRGPCARCCWSARRSPRNGRLYNCAVAIARGRVLGVVPKTFLPNYREYYEKRWFASGAGLTGLTIELGGEDVPFGTDLIFAADDLPGFVFHAEICEDYWAPTPPSTAGALAGALICCNLSRVEHRHRQGARARDAVPRRNRRARCAPMSIRPPGPGESTTDLAWDGQGLIHELGELLAESAPVRRPSPSWSSPTSTSSGCAQERLRIGTFNDAAALAGHPETRFRRIGVRSRRRRSPTSACERAIRRFPFVPNDPAQARRRLLRGVQHPGRGARQAARARRGAETAGDRRLGRARFDPRADRRGQGDGPARASRAPTSSASPCPASRPARGPRRTPGR